MGDPDADDQRQPSKDPIVDSLMRLRKVPDDNELVSYF